MARYLCDGLCLVGAGCFVAGAWWIWPPLGMIALGGACVAIGLMGATIIVRRDKDRKGR
jgi:hypothetical protein